MTEHIRIHVDIPLDEYRVLARATHGEVGRLLRTLATRAALGEIKVPKTPVEARPSRRGDYRRPIGSDIAAVRERYWKGRTPYEIADELGIGLTTVYRDITKIKAEPPSDDNPITYLNSTHPEAS